MRRPLLSLLSLLGLALAMPGCVHGGARASAHGSTDPCQDFELEVERVWSTKLEAQIMAKGGEIEVEHRRAVVNKMDRISEDWVRTRTAVCKDHFVRELISEDEYAARVRCFDDRLERQRTLAETLAGGAALADIEGSLDQLLAQPPSCETMP